MYNSAQNILYLMFIFSLVFFKNNNFFSIM